MRAPYALSAREVARELGGDVDIGLTQRKAAERLTHCNPNQP